jgi:hypothetical protein
MATILSDILELAGAGDQMGWQWRLLLLTIMTVTVAQVQFRVRRRITRLLPLPQMGPS